MNKSKSRAKKSQKAKSSQNDKCTYRSAICFSVLLTISIFLGIGLAMLQSFEKSLLATSASDNLGYTYLQVGCENHAKTCEEENPKLWQKYKGEEVGFVKFYHGSQEKPGMFWVVNADAVAPFIVTDLSIVPEDKVAVIVSDYDELKDGSLKPGTSELVGVGSYVPSPFQNIDTENLGIFAALARQTKNMAAVMYLVDDGSGKVENYLREDWGWGDDFATNLESESRLIRFKDYDAAISYAHEADQIDSTLVSDVFGNTLAIDSIFRPLLRTYYIILGLAGVLTLITLAGLIYTKASQKR